jgi:serine/threonine protein kinase
MNQLVREQARSPPTSFSPLGEKNGIGPYIFKENLGHGTTGTVKLAYNTSFGTKSAVKIVNKTVTRKRKEAKKEISVLQNLDHKHIIKLEHVEEDPMFIYIFTEYYEEGDLYAYIQRKGLFEESSAKHLFRQMVEAVDFCHKKLRICHHDIKLENLVINGEKHLKLIDFGFAIDLEPSVGKKIIKNYDSSPAYSPLEILQRRPHDETVDIYSLGTCLYYMLVGTFPYCDPHKTSFEELLSNVQSEIIEFPDHISKLVQDLIRRMLRRKSRLTCEEIRYHPWMDQHL